MKGIIHNEAQDGKTELDSWFYHFKRQLKKWMSRFKCAVLTPNHMAEAMEYSTGVKGMRFDIVRLKRNQLDGLFEDKEKCYGALKQRMKQALPSNLAEVRTAADGTNELFESISGSTRTSEQELRLVEVELDLGDADESVAGDQPQLLQWAVDCSTAPAVVRYFRFGPEEIDLSQGSLFLLERDEEEKMVLEQRAPRLPERRHTGDARRAPRDACRPPTHQSNLCLERDQWRQLRPHRPRIPPRFCQRRCHRWPIRATPPSEWSRRARKRHRCPHLVLTTRDTPFPS